ncbi:T-complex protein 11 [Euphorbia peplus]|nr:T-complex protein 11 [Euphorbia peplus]
MATGVDSSSPDTGMNAVALDFPVSNLSSPPPRIPRRLKKRLFESKTPSTVEEIEAKLRHADLRRQQFYMKLSSKARQKPRSPSRSSSNEEDLGQRLEAKLQAAEQKRQRILANAQMRLARLDELRQAAKSGVEMRSERERERLVTKVEMRVQQAEENRMLILKAYRQRRATQRERSSQSLMRRMAWESKYKERVHAAMHQKRVAAERKRLGLLEAEKKRAHARLLQVRRVAKSVSHQREIERRRIREQLENRLQKAKSQRAEYLSKRRRQRNSVQVNWNRMREQADFLSRKLARCWRQFLRSRRTTIDLAKDYDLLNINESSVKSMPFEQLALLIESSATLRTVKSLLDRLENRFRVSKAVDRSNSVSLENIDHLLKRVATPKKRVTPRTSVRSREAKKVAVVKGVTKNPAKLSRYPVRIVLCAYMILGHPDAVLSGQGEREVSLAKSAEEFVQQFELLIRIILDGPIQSSDEESNSMLPKRCTFRSQLAAFDKAFCSYLNRFVVWKVKDAQSLEDDLVRAACQLELSMIQKCKLTPGGDNDALSHDMKAIQKQVMEDQKLFKEKIQHLSGDAGIERMECALSETRSRHFEAMKNGSTVGSPIIHLLSPSSSSPLATPLGASLSGGDDMIDGTERPSRVVRSLFKEDGASSNKGLGSPANVVGHFDDQLGSSVEKLATENELIVNEFLHQRDLSFVDKLSTDGENSIKVKIRETMEEAFWDTILESIKQAEPSYDRVVDLVREVRDGITEMAPKSWKKEIAEAIDLDILSQVLKSGVLDLDYLKKILDFALCTLQKLSSPVHEEELKVMHQKLLNELAETCETQDEVKCSHAIAMIKGLRFVLEQIQVLKQEISKARIRMMEPLLKGPAGLDYLRKAFTNSYGSYTDACARLPLTMQWLSLVKNCKDQEWEEHTNCLSALANHESSSQVFLPSATLRTGGNFMFKMNGSVASSSSVSNATGCRKPEPECKGERIDLFVRLGLLKLSGLVQEAFPETLVLNMPRIRAAQSQIQKIVVISTSLLVCRQALLMERAVASVADLETIISKCSQQLLELLDQLDEVGVEAIVDIISSSLDETIDLEKLQSRKLLMSSMLGKSLQAGDPIFEKVSRAVYLAARGVVLGGSGVQGRRLAEMALKQVGAVSLTERLVETAEALVVVAGVSVAVHGDWYANLVDNM